MRAHLQPFDRQTLAALVAVAIAGATAAACATSGTSPGAGASEAAAAGAASTARDCTTARGLRLSVGGAAAAGEGRPTPAGTVIGPAMRSAETMSVRDPRVALAQICEMMSRAAAAWNRGDLDAFMSDYLAGEGTTYIGRRGITRGPEAIRGAYAPRFAPGAQRDSLSFEDVEVDLLAPDLANTIAWYVLMRGDSVRARGPTSLVMRRVQGRWKIVHDHSS